MSACEHHVPTDTLAQLLSRNEAWASENSSLFPMSSQNPPVLWIGCSDSRVPESVVTKSQPGHIFTTRTIANIVKPTLYPQPLDQEPTRDDVDPNSDSAIIFPVSSLGVHHIVVVGHTRCGGVAACLPSESEGKARGFNVPSGTCAQKDPVEEPTFERLPISMQRWLKPIRDIVLSWPSGTPTLDEAIEANIREQVRTVARSTVVQDYWFGEGRGCLVGVHGWLYDVESGELKDLGFNITAKTPREDYLPPSSSPY